MERMRILQIIQRPQLRGAEIFACQLSQEFKKRGFRTDVVVLFNDVNFALDFDLNFISLHANQRKRLWDMKAYKRLSRIIKEGKYDIVQANAADTLKYAAMSKLFFRWRAKLVFRNASLMGRLMHSSSQRVYNRWLLSRCDQIVSVSENCRQDLIRFFPKAKSSSITIASGTNFQDNVETQILPRPAEAPVFLHVGSFVWEKNHEFLLAVFAKYIERFGQAYLWLVGDGKLQSSVREKAKQMELDKWVVFWGTRKDVSAFLNSADLLIMPSVVEGIPGVILEALAHGLPVLASNAGGIPEVIRHNVNGLCLTEWKEEDYARCMNTLTTDTSLRTRLTHEGKQTIKNIFNIGSIAEQFLSCYANVIGK